MNAIAVLELQHHDIEELFERLLSAATLETKRKLFAKLTDSLAIHAAIEEHHFYPTVREEHLPTSIEEELEIKSVLADLHDIEIGDEAFNAKMSALLEVVEHHVATEELNLFPKVKEALDGKALEDLGEAMSAEQAQLEETTLTRGS
jgi:hemerythrin superfamily protein